MRSKLWLFMVFGSAAALAAVAAAQHPSFESKLDKDRQILHALDRLTFGPQPGDIERVRKLGLKKWIDQQLNPEHMSENPELKEKLLPLETLEMHPDEEMLRYPTRQVAQQVKDGKRGYPADPFLRAAVANLIAQQQVKKQAAAKDDVKTDTPDADAAADERLKSYLTADQIQKLQKGSPADKKAVLAAMPAKKLDATLIAMPRGLRGKLVGVAPPDIRRKLMLLNNPPQAVTYDLWEGKTYRAIYSDRQLAEVLDDFWFNHFNVYLDKGQDRYMLGEYERRAIRPHVLGKFRDLLQATATSPAMLFYLDNWESVGPHSMVAEKAKNKKRGLNENYGRELMELHTLGVNGGYTQKDVVEVARCFSGWTIHQPRLGGEFFFDPKMHDPGKKTVLGHKIKAGGMQDGEQVLDILARHPATARHISFELAQRFVADDPPQALVDRMAKTFLETDGDIRSVMKTMLNSPEFWSEGAYLAKVKTPFEMAVSAVRVLDADVDDAYVLTNQISTLGQPLYRKQEPTGYSNAGSDWMNSAALLARLNFSLALTRNKLPGIQVDTMRFVPENEPGGNPDPALMAQMLLMRPATPQTLAAIENARQNERPKNAAELRQYLAALVVGSPDFQRH